MLWVQILMMALAVVLGILAGMNALAPLLLLALVTLNAFAGTLHTPAWMRTVPDLLSGHDVPLGVTLNSTAVNVARLSGGILAGFLLAHAPAGSGFFANAATYLPLVLVLLAWPGAKRESALPPERIPGAMAAGVRYVRHSTSIRIVLLRTTLFVLSASAFPALLPVVARRELHLDALWFGIFLGAFGAGALIGASLLSQLRERLTTNQLITVMSLVLAAATAILSQARDLLVLVPCCC